MKFLSITTKNDQVGPIGLPSGRVCKCGWAGFSTTYTDLKIDGSLGEPFNMGKCTQRASLATVIHHLTLIWAQKTVKLSRRCIWNVVGFQDILTEKG